MATEVGSASCTATMVSPADAYRLVLDAARPLPATRVPLMEAVGRPVAESVHADRHYPPFRRAMMDGYAVSLASAGQAIAVVGRRAAGPTTASPVVTRWECVEITTGAACPEGTEAVVQREHVRFEGERVVLPAAIQPGRHIAEPGSDCGEGEVLLKPGDIVTPLAIAALASIGRQEVAVVRAPRVAVIVTGEELAGGRQDLRQGEIRDANGPMLMALAIDARLPLAHFRRVGDDPVAIQAALEDSIGCDLVLLSGGASVGPFDFVPAVLAGWGAEIVFHKVRQKPGKPLLMARRGESLIFALPGNPLACHFGFCRYVRAAAARMGGYSQSTAGEARLSSAVQPDRGRVFFVPASVYPDPCGGELWRADPMPGASSADIFRTHQANAYVEVPPGAAPLPAGSAVAVSFVASDASIAGRALAARLPSTAG